MMIAIAKLFTIVTKLVTVSSDHPSWGKFIIDCDLLNQFEGFLTPKTIIKVI